MKKRVLAFGLSVMMLSTVTPVFAYSNTDDKQKQIPASITSAIKKNVTILNLSGDNKILIANDLGISVSELNNVLSKTSKELNGNIDKYVTIDYTTLPATIDGTIDYTTLPTTIDETQQPEIYGLKQDEASNEHGAVPININEPTVCEPIGIDSNDGYQSSDKQTKPFVKPSQIVEADSSLNLVGINDTTIDTLAHASAKSVEFVENVLNEYTLENLINTVNYEETTILPAIIE